MTQSRLLFIAQRASAILLGPLVLIHLGLILFAVRGGLSASEILGRTQGSLGWGLFYGLFVVAASVHAPIGIRNVLREWTAFQTKVIDLVCLVFGVVLLLLGMRAVVAVI